MNVDISSFLTPDGRWNMLQDWLEESPKHQRTLDAWLEMTPEEVFPEIREVVAEIATRKYGPLAGALVRVTKMSAELRGWIETLQTCYRDRKGIFKEEKHVGKNRRTIKG